MEPIHELCPVCRTQATRRMVGSQDLFEVECSHCGTIRLSGPLVDDLDRDRIALEDRERLSRALANAKLQSIVLTDLQRGNWPNIARSLGGIDA
jgi:Zn ribbon nucleic-acid-binding protein